MAPRVFQIELPTRSPMTATAGCAAGDGERTAPFRSHALGRAHAHTAPDRVVLPVSQLPDLAASRLAVTMQAFD